MRTELAVRSLRRALRPRLRRLRRLLLLLRQLRLRLLLARRRDRRRLLAGQIHDFLLERRDLFLLLLRGLLGCRGLLLVRLLVQLQLLQAALEQLHHALRRGRHRVRRCVAG